MTIEEADVTGELARLRAQNKRLLAFVRQAADYFDLPYTSYRSKYAAGLALEDQASALLKEAAAMEANSRQGEN